MTGRSIMEAAIGLALDAHEGQRDWNGCPFILHPMRVGMALAQQYDELHGAVGVLHDSVEDSNGLITKEIIAANCGTLVAEAVDLLTRREAEHYDDEYLVRVMTDRLATRVKLADLADNLGPFRLMVANDHQAKVLVRHGRALHRVRDYARTMKWI